MVLMITWGGHGLLISIQRSNPGKWLESQNRVYFSVCVYTLPTIIKRFYLKFVVCVKTDVLTKVMRLELRGTENDTS